MEFPALKEAQVGEDVVGIGAGFTNHDVAGDDQRDFLRVGQDFDGRLRRWQGVIDG